MLHFYNDDDNTIQFTIDKDFDNICDFIDWYQGELQWCQEPFNSVDKQAYYQVTDDAGKILGVITLRKGCTFSRELSS